MPGPEGVAGRDWLGVVTGIRLKTWFHLKIKLFQRILGSHGTTSEMKQVILAAKIIFSG